MPPWKIEVYDNRDDTEPSRTGYVDAKTEAEAADYAKHAMGSSPRADATPIKIS
jgi:hypothetical protein